MALKWMPFVVFIDIGLIETLFSRPSYSADWGDYVSFTTHMRAKAEAQGQDLLVIDTGDRVEGNGLWDSSEPKGVYVS